MDRYTKCVLTVIATALVVLALRPLFDPRMAQARDVVDVRIVEIKVAEPAQFAYEMLPVRCVRGCSDVR
jgi:hypothetical protein